MHQLEKWPSGRRRSPAKGVWGNSHRGFESLFLRLHPYSAPVAQLDRVLGYEPRGRRFEPFRAHHSYQKLNFFPQKDTFIKKNNINCCSILFFKLLY